MTKPSIERIIRDSRAECLVLSRGEAKVMVDEIVRLRKVLLMVASGHQGGHSASGGAIADLFGIPFPLTMPDLEIAAKKHGFDPNDLWPWLAPMRAGKTS